MAACLIRVTTLGSGCTSFFQGICFPKTRHEAHMPQKKFMFIFQYLKNYRNKNLLNIDNYVGKNWQQNEKCNFFTRAASLLDECRRQDQRFLLIV